LLTHLLEETHGNKQVRLFDKPEQICENVCFDVIAGIDKVASDYEGVIRRLRSN